MFDIHKRHWTLDEEKFVSDNIGTLTIREISRHLEKTESAVQQYIHRKRINPYERVVKNLVREILTIKFINPDYFTPTREFYDTILINQKRWWDLYYGRKPITDMEYKRLAEHFNIPFDAAIDAKQLNLFKDGYSAGDY
ncbi:MAG: XRE family transcriptional regulator [Odoribacter sp.]